MAKRRRMFFLAALSVMLTGVAVFWAYGQFVPEGLEVKRLRVDDSFRRYLVYVPSTPAPKSGFPLVFVMHGGGGAAPQIARHLKVHEHTTGKKFIVVYPESTMIKLKRNWNDGRTATQPGREALAKINDVKYLHAVLDQVEKDHRVDKSRVFAAGVSNGAFMSQRLAAESNRFAAIGPVIGSMAESIAKDFDPPSNVSVMLINGVDDPLVPYKGGMVRFGKSELGKGLPVEAVAKKWVGHNRCSARPKIEKLADRDPDDGTQVTRITYTGGRGGTEVQLLKIDGGGHNWPSTAQYARESLIGKTCRDFDATEELLQFFLKHPRQ